MNFSRPCLGRQAFIVVMRWVITVLAPFLSNLSRSGFDLYGYLGFIVYFLVTLNITVSYLRSRTLNTSQWGIIHALDLLAVTLIVTADSEFYSESYNLYYLVILQAGLVFGIKHALLTLLTGNILYISAILFMVPSEIEIDRLLMRVLYSWLIGVTGTYMAFQETKHRKQAITDHLTNTYNRSYLDENLNLELQRAKEEQTYLSIIMVDIDNFKRVNDTYGHDIGDVVLEHVAQIIKKSIRDVDFVARYGGEEFIVTLPGIGVHKAGEIAERIRQAVEHTERISGRIPVTVSCGVASFPFQATCLQELIRKADEHLYEAKRAGRNRVFYKRGTQPKTLSRLA